MKRALTKHDTHCMVARFILWRKTVVFLSDVSFSKHFNGLSMYFQKIAKISMTLCNMVCSIIYCNVSAVGYWHSSKVN